MKSNPIAPRKRRLRKKLRVDDFQAFGFCLNCEVDKSLTDDQHMDLIDDFITIIEDHNLYIFGGLNDVYVYGGKKTKVTNQHQKIVQEWLTNRKEIISVLVGPLEDAWYGHVIEPS